MIFILPYKVFSFSSHLNFCLDFLVMQKKKLNKIRLISKLMTSNLVNKQLKETYCPISHEVKATRQGNLVS